MNISILCGATELSNLNPASISARGVSLFTLNAGALKETTSSPDMSSKMAFAVLSLSQVVHAFNLQSDKSIFEVGFLSNISLVLAFVACTILQVSVISIPFLSTIFKTVNLNFCQWLIVWLLSISPLVLVEIEKLSN